MSRIKQTQPKRKNEIIREKRQKERKGCVVWYWVAVHFVTALIPRGALPKERRFVKVRARRGARQKTFEREKTIDDRVVIKQTGTKRGREIIKKKVNKWH